jgi:prolyl 4-hydroxylase
LYETVGTGTLAPGLTLKQLKDRPRVYVVHDFLSDAECDHIIALGTGDMEQSITVDMNTGLDAINSDRTSTSTWLVRGEDPVVAEVERRLAELINLPAGHGCNINLLRYRLGQQYAPHDDFFDPDEPGLKETIEEQGQRFLSVLLYLSDVEEGGETFFPEAGLEFKPVKRATLLFYNVLPDGSIDRFSHHGSAPVIRGEKWVGTKWIMERDADNR